VVGEYENAIASYAEIIDQYPDDTSVLREYAGAVEGMKAEADRSFDSEDWIAAEKIYALLSANFPRFAPFEKRLSFGTSLLDQRILECRIKMSEGKARQSLAAGKYQSALDSYRSLPPEVLRMPPVSAGLRRIMEELKRLADTAMARKDFQAAGKGYFSLRKGDPLIGQAGVSLPFSTKGLEDGIQKCRAQLTKDGLDLYRKGHLKEAIAIWQGLLEFDPENAEIRKAVDTAAEQLKKLKRE
jgi:tetratricopeptide (TPR) repeat protein